MKVTQTTQFRKDVKRQIKRGKAPDKLTAAIELLIAGEELPEKLRDHALIGEWNGWRDCHVDSDWLLIYKRLIEELVLGRTGSHADLF
ncbi:MAG TPA: type II toxin-antitoxin system YafQ family toxin [Verrucomicrobiales bacterium]|nr:type II toxin-antitoxin system YafQ family toxin [Verrucomicrobiales bacterium]